MITAHLLSEDGEKTGVPSQEDSIDAAASYRGEVRECVCMRLSVGRYMHFSVWVSLWCLCVYVCVYV